MSHTQLLSNLGFNSKSDTALPGTYAGQWSALSDDILESKSPIDRQQIAKIKITQKAEYEAALISAQQTFLKWRTTPAPKRGEIIRQIGQALRQHKENLGKLVSVESGKILAEGLGEVQEAIDIADFAVGLSRQLYGLSMHSERPQHRMYEQWQPLGVVGVITAFNFPAAVWAWNAFVAAVCGNTVIWKASEHTPATAIAMIKVSSEIATEHGFPGLFNLVTGNGPELGQMLAADLRVPMISATGSCRMGKSVAQVVAARFGKSLLELGGNNAIIIMDDADLDLAVRATVFGAVGTAGQRCTTIRRILIQKNIKEEFIKRLISAYKSIKIGNPLQTGILMGPLINQAAVDQYENAIAQISKQGGKILYGGKKLSSMPSDFYVEPTIVSANKDMPLVREETFAPIVYVIDIDNVDHAIEINNSVAQGLSSAIFTQNLQTAERFLSASGSDCGIANVNIGTSGAEIGGAFGGEKETGGGRESGSDSWKQYMRRQTVTINYGNELPLAQGIEFV